MVSLSIFFFILGTVVGSFLNVIIYRIPKGMSIVKPGSHCPNCGTPIRFYDNIPIISYIILKGKCRTCGSRISPVYPIVEGLTGLVFLSIFIKFHWSIPIVIKYLILSSLLIAISLIDFQEKVIPDILTIPWIGVGLLATLLIKDLPILQVLLSTVISGFFLWILRVIFSKLILKREALGEGDIFLIMLIGSFAGLWGVYLSLLLGSIIALVAHLIFPDKLKGEIPFGPFLSMGAFIGILTL
ncbi:MAG TPA: prepilin peptidase [Candidatus Hydrothermia bacterium]|nr:prepilin peptidase [Candidatus Hydrothermae bacterium]MDD3648997.1 prepilin peptidase [Candidatus Hydrothermia bacterium]MDD5572589.1 prepilin peptidase [Candidatus Hydrothermia bacterium]HOK23238.1 prepilin peptidase [Candidatus Hydrothermia bacterium]HOL23942.1 prepilin peptidase [Candidatus Hydrothermia bacterium]